MSANQSHKNRLNRYDDPNGVIATGKRMIGDKRRMDRQAEGMAHRAERDPKTNPSGKASFRGDVSLFGYKSAVPMPDQGHAARLRGKRAHWDKKP